MYKAKLISADFESLTLQFKCIGEGFTEIKVPTEDYIILSKEEFEELSEKANLFDKQREHKKRLIHKLL